MCCMVLFHFCISDIRRFDSHLPLFYFVFICRYILEKHTFLTIIDYKWTKYFMFNMLRRLKISNAILMLMNSY